jgi:hypothetical protein
VVTSIPHANPSRWTPRGLATFITVHQRHDRSLAIKAEHQCPSPSPTLSSPPWVASPLTTPRCKEEEGGEKRRGKPRGGAGLPPSLGTPEKTETLLSSSSSGSVTARPLDSTASNHHSTTILLPRAQGEPHRSQLKILDGGLSILLLYSIEDPRGELDLGTTVEVLPSLTAPAEPPLP